MKTLTRDNPDVTIEVTCLPADEGPEGHFSLDEGEEAATIRAIRDDMEWNEWAWCVARVRAKWGTLYADAYLGGCSYRNEAEFTGDAYYEDMVDEALGKLNAEIARLDARINALRD